MLLLSFPILRSEFYRYRQNPNGTIKHLFQFEPRATANFSSRMLGCLMVRLRSILLGLSVSGRDTIAGREKGSIAFFEKKFKRPIFSLLKNPRFPRKARFHQHLRTFRHSGSDPKKIYRRTSDSAKGRVFQFGIRPRDKPSQRKSTCLCLQQPR